MPRFSPLHRSRSRRRPPLVFAAGALGTLALSLSMNGTLSAFTASITNSVNNAASGYLAMGETLLDSSGNATSTTCSSNSGGSVATNAATCASINKYGGTTTGLTPGGTGNVTRIAIANTGTVPATSFTLGAGMCSATASTYAGGASVPCSKLRVVITSGSTTVYNGMASALPSSTNLLSALGVTSVAPGQSIPFTFSVSLDSTADNTYAGYTFSQPLTWTFTS